MNDAELLQEYASSKSEAVFRALVERHLPMVYSAALRQAGNADLAEDVTQVVFIILARKATLLSSATCLAGWLFRTTRHTAAKAVRSEQRRRRRELEALQMQAAQTDDIWQQVAPGLDEALAQLGEVERNAVLLHYFQHKRLRDVGRTLGLSEDAAEKRIARAIDKLRRLLLKRHVALPVVIIPGLLMARGAQVPPPGLGGAVAAAALGEAALSTAVFALLQSAVRESVWPAVGAVLAKAAVLGLVALVVSLTVHYWPWPTREDPSAFSFETRIVLRPRSVTALRLPKPAPLPAEAAPALAAASPPAGQPPTRPEPSALATPTPATNVPTPPSAVAKAEPATAQPSGPTRAGAAAAPAAPSAATTPAMWPAPYPAAYPLPRTTFTIAPRLQPVSYPLSSHRRNWRQPSQPQMQPALYVGNAPWMPAQRSASPAPTKSNPPLANRKQP
ncbi:MAG TPA: sigma-70 family RNA polymerase sigma factor [Verrucomicrobiae bacterium]